MTKTRVLAWLALLPALAIGCGLNNSEDEIESSSHLIAVGNVVNFEAESLARTASTTAVQVTSESAASGGQYVQLTGTPSVGAWIQFTLPNVEAATYSVKMLYKSNNNRGIVQTSIDGTNQGSACDEYAATAAYQVACSLGSKALGSGNHTIRFTVTGKSSASQGYMMVIDKIVLTATAVSGTGGSSGSGGSTGAGGTGGSIACPTGQVLCGSVCATLSSDVTNCGVCGRVCAAGNTCSGGTCVISCPVGQFNCAGTCANPSYDPNNCGACGHTCLSGTTCSGGNCVVSCPAGQYSCAGLCTSLTTDNANCGSCGHSCLSGTACWNGTCTNTCGL
jgi:hypothetical protein